MSERPLVFRVAVSAYYRWVVAVGLWYAAMQAVKTTIDWARSGQDSPLLAGALASVTGLFAGVLTGLVFVAPLIAARYAVVRKSSKPTFWASEAKWSDIAGRALILGAAIGGLGAIVDQDHQSNPSPIAASSATPTAKPLATPAVPTTAAIGHVARIIVATLEKNQKTLPPVDRHNAPISNHFMHSRKDASAFLDLLVANNVSITIDDIRGRVVDVTSRYDLPTAERGAISFVRRETWLFIHGKAGWMEDDLTIGDHAIVAIADADHLRTTVTNSAYDPATGKITFSENGYTLAWVPLPKLSWRIDTISSPPTATPVREVAPQQEYASSVATAAPTTGSNVPPPPADNTNSTEDAQPEQPNDCSTETIETVSDDGAFIQLLDGRKYLIDDTDRVTTSVWVAPDDVVLCDPGPGEAVTIIKDDETVHAGHIDP